MTPLTLEEARRLELHDSLKDANGTGWTVTCLALGVVTIQQLLTNDERTLTYAALAWGDYCPVGQTEVRLRVTNGGCSEGLVEACSWLLIILAAMVFGWLIGKGYNWFEPRESATNYHAVSDGWTR